MTSIITPVGTAQYPWLNNPDTKWHELGEYKVNLILDATDAEAVIEAIDQELKAVAAKNKAKKRAPLPFTEELGDNGEPTGRYIFKCKSRNRMNKKGELWDRKPILVDAQGNKTDVSIGGGSKLRLKLELYGWANSALGAGVSLQIKAVQIIELEEFVKKEFDSIEGGFEDDGSEARGTQTEDALF